MTTPTTQPVRHDIDALYATLLHAAHTADELSHLLEEDGRAAAGGCTRRAIGHIWRASEDLHSAFHDAPPRPEAHVPLPTLCARRMRYLAVQARKKARA